MNETNVIQIFTLWRFNLQEVDWEVELAFVIGRKGKHIKVVFYISICILKSKCSVNLLVRFSVLNITCVISAAIAGHNHI